MAVSLAAIRKEKSFRHLKDFFRYGWEVLEPDVALEWNWHIDAVCDHVEAAFRGWIEVRRANQKGEAPPPQTIQNLIINIPPGTAKSRIVMVYSNAWMWLQEPSWRAIAVSGNPRVAVRDSMLTRNLIRSGWYRGWFDPQWRLTAEQDAKTLFTNTAGGSRMAIGVGASIVGDRGDALLLDDLNDPDEGENGRNSTNEWWDLGAGNRVNDLRTSLRVLIQQRVHEDDATGHITQSLKCEHVVIDMEHDLAASAKRPASAIGWVDPRTTEGELLFPARFTPEILAAERKRLGTFGYSGQYQQAPAPKGGSVFREDWFPRYLRMPPFRAVWTAWDTALKEREENDETASWTFGAGTDNMLYALRMWHGREDTPKIGKRLVAQAERLRAVYGDRYLGDYIEDKVSGTTLMQYLRRSNSELVLIPVRAEADKVTRAQGVSPYCEGGGVLLPDGGIYPATQGWVRDGLTGLTSFPKAKHDDIVDAFVHGVRKHLGKLPRGGKGRSRRRAGAGYA